MDLKYQSNFQAFSYCNFDTRVEKLGVDLVFRFSSKVVSLFVGIMIYFVVSMSSELVVIFIEEEDEVVVVVVSIPEPPGPRDEVSDLILSVLVYSVVREGV